MELPLSRTQRRWFAASLVAVFVFSLLHFDGPSRGYWDTYITVPAMFMTGQEVELVTTDGSPRFDYELTGRIPDDTFDPSENGFGISSKDQRIGAAILFAAPFALFKLAAFRWGYAACWGLMFAFAFLALRRVLGRRDDAGEADRTLDGATFSAALFGALLLVFNPFSLYLDRLNGNLFGLAVFVLLFFLMTERKPHWWLVGLVFGLAGGIRNVAIVLGPMLALLMWFKCGGFSRSTIAPFARNMAVCVAAAAVAILPVLLWNQYAYGAMLIHPSQVEHLQGWRPTFPHTSLFGNQFEFNGLLNWPFHDQLVRTPHFGYPTSMLWPLITVQSLGVVLAALAPIGVVALFKRRRLEAVALLYWYLAYYGLFIFQENWEELKQTFMALHLFPLVAFVSAGALWLARAPRDWKRWAAVAAISAALTGAVLSARLVDAPADERWYYRFPHAGANDSGLDGLPEELRKDWHFFYTRENEAEIAREQRRLSTPSPFPALYRPVHFADSDDIARMRAEPFERELRTLAIWSYIYE